MEKMIYICDECKVAFSDFEESSPNCPQCGRKLLPTYIRLDAWKQMNESEKQKIKNGNSGSEAESGSEEKKYISKKPARGLSIDSGFHELICLVKQMQHDIHFMYVILLIEVICAVIAAVLWVLASILIY